MKNWNVGEEEWQNSDVKLSRFLHGYPLNFMEKLTLVVESHDIPFQSKKKKKRAHHRIWCDKVTKSPPRDTHNILTLYIKQKKDPIPRKTFLINQAINS